MRAVILIAIFLSLSAGIGLAQESQTPDPSNVRKEQINSAWLSAEAGVHNLDFTYWPSETAAGGSFSLRFPVGSRVALLLLYEKTFSTRAYKSLGGGIEVSIFRTEEFDLLPALAIFTDNREDTGFLFSVTPAYKILDGLLRVQATLGYRLGGEFSMGGGNSVSAFSASAGIGLSVNHLLGRE